MGKQKQEYTKSKPKKKKSKNETVGGCYKGQNLQKPLEGNNCDSRTGKEKGGALVSWTAHLPKTKVFCTKKRVIGKANTNVVIFPLLDGLGSQMGWKPTVGEEGGKFGFFLVEE